jgi:CD109 antigen
MDLGRFCRFKVTCQNLCCFLQTFIEFFHRLYRCESIKITKTVPDTITSWIVSAFSLNKVNGLGLMDAPASLTVFKSFFISTTLPYSVKRGEALTMSIQVFNYLAKDQEVLVKVSNAALQFDFTDDNNSDLRMLYYKS